MLRNIKRDGAAVNMLTAAPSLFMLFVVSAHAFGEKGQTTVGCVVVAG